MKKHLAAITLATLAGFAVSGARAADIFAGKGLYEAHCVACHGPDGNPLVPGAAYYSRGESLERPDSMLLETIRTGRNLMPAWDRILSETDMINVLGYIRTLPR